VWGQLNIPVESDRAAASASSGSEACSTTPSNFLRVRMALWTLTGLPIWMAEAWVLWGTMGANRSNPARKDS
jgi:hypothetical protein